MYMTCKQFHTNTMHVSDKKIKPQKTKQTKLGKHALRSIAYDMKQNQ